MVPKGHAWVDELSESAKKGIDVFSGKM